MARTPSTTKPKMPAAAKKPKPAVQKQAPQLTPDATPQADNAAPLPVDAIVPMLKDEAATRRVIGEVLTRPDSSDAGEQIESEQIEIVYVKSVPVTLRRCGFRFSQEGMGIALSCLTPEQLEILEADPDLVVQRGSVDAIRGEA